MSFLTKVKLNLICSTIKNSSLARSRAANCALNVTQRRTTATFLTTLKGEDLWRATTTVSNPGKKRGRGKGAGRKRPKDLNRGQIFGVGKVNMIWPGLNAPIIRGRETLTRRKLPEDPSYAENLIRYRNELDVFKKIKMPPLERGWSSNKVLGRWIGTPETNEGEELTGFNTKIVMIKPFFEMSGSLGKKRKMRLMAITGNKNGAVGYALVEGSDQNTLIKNAAFKAAQNLIFCNIHDGHTITHDFYSRYNFVKVFAHKKPPGYGVVAHRVIKAICDCVGIKDIFVSIEGPKRSYHSLVRAFLIGLSRQKTYQELADEKQLHLVEFREERDYFPVVVASPSNGIVRKREEILPDEVMDFHMHLYNGLIRVQKAPKLPAYTRAESYAKYLQGWHRTRSRQDVRVYLKAKYGAVESFLTIREKEERERRKAMLAKQQMSASQEEHSNAEQ